MKQNNIHDIKSLDEAVNNNALEFMTNDYGAVCNPDNPLATVEEDAVLGVLTPKEIVLRKKIQQSGPFTEYVLRTYNPDSEAGSPEIGIGIPFTPDVCEGLVKAKTGKTPTPEQVSEVHMPKLQDAVLDALATFCAPKLPDECDVYMSNEVTSEGFEVLVVVPFELKESVAEIEDVFYDIYDKVASIFEC